MTIKNISGETRYFHLYGTKGVSLANNASTTVADEPEAITRVMALVADQLLEITVPPVSAQLAAPPDRPSVRSVTMASAGTATQYLTVEGVSFQLYANAGSTAAAIAAGRTPVEMGVAGGGGAGNAGDTLTNMVAAINADTTLAALGIFANGPADTVAAGTTAVLYIVRADGDIATDITAASSGASMVVAAAADGADRSRKRMVMVVSPAMANTDDIASVFTGLKTVDFAIVEHRTSAGVVVIPTGATVTYTGGFVTVNPIGAAFATGDVLTIIAYGDAYRA